MTGKVSIDITDFTVPDTQSTDPDDFLDELDEILDLNRPEAENPVPQQHVGEDEQFSELIVMKGCSFHNHFQEALYTCKQLMLNENAPQLSLNFEPTNKRDENAITVHALLADWTPIGYIPANKVPKVTDAMQNDEITLVALDNVIYRYIHALGCH